MIVVVDYSVGDVVSISNALTKLNVEHIITKKEVDISGADKIILPNAENAYQSAKMLHLLNLFTLLRVVKKPVLGLGSGMHILCDHIEEENISCLGIINSEIRSFDENKVDVPHNSWRKLEYVKESLLFKGIDKESSFFFDHHFYVPRNQFTIASSFYGVEFTAALEKDYSYGVQFIPEKSGEAGLMLIKNFVELC